MIKDSTAPRGRRSWVAPLLLGLLCLLVYNANLRCINAGDTLAARYLPLGIWRHGTVALDPIAGLVAHGHPSLATWTRPPRPASAAASGVVLLEPWAYWIIRGHDGVLASVYPIVAPLLVAPLYLPAVAYLRVHGWQPWQVDWIAAAMEKVSASLLASITVLLVYRLLRRDGGPGGGWSLPLALAFAFGTNTWMIGSQALWQHGAGALLVVVALLLVTSSRQGPARWAALGAVAVAMAANRPPDVFLAAAMVLYAVCTARRATVWVALALGAMLPLALLLAYNLGVTGSLAGGYGTVDQRGFLKHSIPAGLAGLLLSPTRGLLVFSPFLLFVPLGLVRRLRSPDRPHRLLAVSLLVGILAQLVLYAMADWRQGHSWGPRWLTDMLPILLWMLAPAALALRPAARALLGATIVASIAIQAIGAFWYTGESDQALYASADWAPAAWRLDNAPFVAALRDSRWKDRPPGDLACSARGHVDTVGSAPAAEAPGVPAPVIASGMRLQGWALACGRTPSYLLLLVGGRVIGHTGQFSAARPDVAAAMGSAAPSAWSVEATTAGLAPGEHVLQVAVRTGERSDLRIVSESRVLVRAESTAGLAAQAASAAVAAARLREHQTAEGYWLTTFTAGTRFENPGKEMNTYLTATLVDFAAPVAKENGLEAALGKARRHLTAQIEADGLVRYHGLPEGPGMGVLGCPITPDTDDTALVWRIAPPPAGDSRRGSMPGVRKVLENYRDARGFYRTWLSPRERYQCIDPGRDPNPADVTIQMNLLLMFAESGPGNDPAAARSLCQALAQNVADENLWVYYERSPSFRCCALSTCETSAAWWSLPEERLAKVTGQERWMAVVRALVSRNQAATSDSPGGLGLLDELARDDFAELRRVPPLLYHNDLTASVSRYYWSEDFGYVLWLRLYEKVRAAAERLETTQ